MTTPNDLGIDDRVWIDPDAPTEHAGKPAQVWGFARDGRVALLVAVPGIPMSTKRPSSVMIRIAPEYVIKDTREDRVELEDVHGERQWIEGHRASYRRLLQLACGELRALGVATDEKELKEGWAIAQLEDVRVQLRSVCRELDARVDISRKANGWEDNLYLGDAIEKHLGRALAELLDTLDDPAALDGA
jgi:hypothetical protein